MSKPRRIMIRNRDGFTLVELMVTMVVFVMVIAASSSVFTGLLTQFKQQSKIAESNIEGVVGLEILRSDIEHAGYGLPWIVSGVAYQEAEGGDPYGLNDAPSGVPRAVAGSNNTGYNGSDYFTVKAVNVALNRTCQKWTRLAYEDPTKSTSLTLRSWEPAVENLGPSDYVILVTSTSKGDDRTLVTNGGLFSTKFDQISASTSSPWSPKLVDPPPSHIIYGVDPDTAPRMPFNRADYFMRRPSNIPKRCAPNTGVLYKATVNHSDGRLNSIPLLDCVADMQVVFGLDTSNPLDERIDNYTSSISGLTANQIRKQLKEVRVYVFAHEGQIDRSFSYPNQVVQIPSSPDYGTGAGSSLDLKATIGDDYKYYRWKLYTMVVKPYNLLLEGVQD